MFVNEDLIGHVTFARNLWAAAEADREVDGTYLPLGPEQRGLIERIPPVSLNWSLRSSLRTRVLLARRAGTLDGLLIHSQTPSLLSVGVMRRIPTVLSIDATPLQFDDVGAPYGHARADARVEMVKRAIVRRAYTAARHLVAWAPWVRDSIVDDYAVDPCRIEVIHPGTRIPGRAAQPGSDGGALRLLFVGGDFERKGGSELLVAVARLGCEWRLDVVTREHVPTDCPRVIVHNGVRPYSDELLRLYLHAHAFVLPSRGDAVPHVILEAMASGLPIVATRVGAIPDLIEDGVNGLLVNPGDATALGDALAILAADAPLRARLGAAGRERARRDYDARINLPRILGLMKRSALGS